MSLVERPKLLTQFTEYTPLCGYRADTKDSYLQQKTKINIYYHSLIILNGVSICVLPFSSIIRHLHNHFFYSHILLHTKNYHHHHHQPINVPTAGAPSL
jgi:hypothetical protein